MNKKQINSLIVNKELEVNYNDVISIASQRSLINSDESNNKIKYLFDYFINFKSFDKDENIKKENALKTITNRIFLMSYSN